MADESQRETAARVIAEVDASGFWKGPVVTTIEPLGSFTLGEDYHQEYYALNKDKNPYCRAVITPKLKKLGLKY